MANQPNTYHNWWDLQNKPQKYLDKLYTHDITTLVQIQNKNNLIILTQEEYQTIYKHTPKTIKEAL